MRQERLVTSADVLLEILRRSTTIRRPDAIQPAFDAITPIVDAVLSVEAEDVKRARTILLSRRGMSARNAIHVAVMERHGIARIMSFDHHFDQVPGMERIPGAS